MSIFDDIRKDRDFCGKLPGFAACDCEEDGCFHDQVNAAQVRRVSRLDRLERIALAAAELAKASSYYKDFVLDHTGNSEVVPVFTEPLQRLDLALAAFRAACGGGE